MIQFNESIAVPAWTMLLQDGNVKVRKQAALALRMLALGGHAETAIDVLIEALGDSDDSVRLYSVRALGDMAPASARALPAICDLLQDESSSVRAHAVRALGAMGAHARPAIPVLREVRKTGNNSFRRAIDVTIQSINRAQASP